VLVEPVEEDGGPKICVSCGSFLLQPMVDTLQGAVWWYATVKNAIMMVQNHQGGNKNDFSR